MGGTEEGVCEWQEITEYEANEHYLKAHTFEAVLKERCNRSVLFVCSSVLMYSCNV